MGSDSGGYDRTPADISQEEWDQHRGEVLRISGEIAVLRTRADQAMRDLRNVSKQMEAIVKRQAKHSDWRDTVQETTGRHDLELLQKELAKYEEKEKWRVALWLKIVLIVFGAIASAAVGHFTRR